jgi:hypothetical protein
MRILAASTDGAGHYGPMVPFLTAAVAAGHEVLVAAPGDVAASAAKSGLEVATLPPSPPDRLGAFFGSIMSVPEVERAAYVARGLFGGINVEATLDTMTDVVASWRPDVVVRESGELASFVAAARAGVPQVQVSIGLRTIDDEVSGALIEDGFGERYGVDATLLRTVRVVSLLPPSLEPSPDARREYYRDPSPVAAGDPPPDDWWPGDERPLVYVTYGSIAAGVGLFPGLYRATVDQLAEVPARVLMTVGRGGAPEVLGPLPPNVHVERWWPQDAALRVATAAVGHGGFGTTLGALVAGVPMVVVPLFSSDQHFNAAAVARSGAGVALPGGMGDPYAIVGGLGDAVTALLADDAARAAARRVADEIAALPPATGWL